MLNLDLKDNIAIVTGATQGLGLGVATMLSKAGCIVCGCGRSAVNEDGAKSFMSITNDSERLFYQTVDVTNNEEVKKFTEKVSTKYGAIDIVVSNAGVNVFTGAENSTQQDWDYNIKLNLESHWHLAVLCKPWLDKSKRGVFQIMTSNHAYASIPGCFPYNVTKTALTGLVKSLAIEWGPSIRVVGIAPGFVDTPGNTKWFDSFEDPREERQRTINMHPAGKLGTTEEVGAFCVFLASDYAGFMTGSTYLMDGGRSALLQD